MEAEATVQLGRSDGRKRAMVWAGPASRLVSEDWQRRWGGGGGRRRRGDSNSKVEEGGIKRVNRVRAMMIRRKVGPAIHRWRGTRGYIGTEDVSRYRWGAD